MIKLYHLVLQGFVNSSYWDRCQIQIRAKFRRSKQQASAAAVRSRNEKRLCKNNGSKRKRKSESRLERKENREGKARDSERKRRGVKMKREKKEKIKVN